MADDTPVAGSLLNSFMLLLQSSFLCVSPAGEPLNDAAAGTGTSTTDWIDLVVGEGGVIDWISP